MDNDLTLMVQNESAIYVIELPSRVSVPEFYAGISLILGTDQISLKYEHFELSECWDWCLNDFEFENGTLIQAEVLDEADYSF